MAARQKVLVLYLATSALDTPVVGWAQYDGFGDSKPMTGDEDVPPYKTGVDAPPRWLAVDSSESLGQPRLG